MNNPRIRLVVVTLFALAGAGLSVAFLPGLLNRLFQAVQSQNPAGPHLKANFSTESMTFDKIVFEPGEKSKAESVLANIRAGKTDFDKEKAALNAKADQGEVQVTKNKLEARGDLKPLLILGPQNTLSGVIDDAELKRPVIYRFLRYGRAAAPTAVDAQPDEYPGIHQPHVVLAMGLLGSLLGAVAANLLLHWLAIIGSGWGRMDSGDRVNMLMGIVIGIVCSFPFLLAFNSLGQVLAPLLTLGLSVCFSIGAVLALRSMDEVLPWQQGKSVRRSGIKILDTNVLIDGRIADIVRTGFLEGELYVPNFVLQELQHIADSPEQLRRQRGRRGLDVLRIIQAEGNVEVGTKDKGSGEPREEVDARLVKLAKSLGADLVSNDYNLNKVASIQHVRVLNLNDLSLALRSNVLPGERLEIQVIREGNQAGQGVGYLDDGTMVVIEGGSSHLTETIGVVVTQVIQTERGKLVFGDLDDDSGTRRTAARTPGRP